MKEKSNKTVFLCIDLLSNEKHIIKIYKNDYINICLNEREILKNAKGNKVSKLINYKADNINIIKYIEGESLQDILKKKYLSKDEALEFTKKICAVLGEINMCYKESIVHCDLKPSNIIVNKETISIIDFENAVVIKDEEVYRKHGTVGYAAPELYGFDSVNVETDIYSVGIMLYEMISKERNNNSDFSIENDNYITLDLKSIVRNCTEFNKIDRYSNVYSLMEDINQINQYWRSTC